MKKFFAILLAVCLCFTLVACGTSTEGEDAGAADVKTYNIGVSIYQFDDNFMTNYRIELEKYFKSLETDTVKYNVQIVDANNDMATQTEQVNTFISQGVDVMMINLVQTSSAETVTGLIADAGIPCVLINREPAQEFIKDKQCYVGADARQSGTYQGEEVLELADKGDLNGDGTINYIMIMGDPENTDAQYRTEYSIKALTDAGMKVNCLFQQTGNWDQAQGQELVANALAQYGDDIEVVFCNNDGMALGAYQAIVAAGRTVNTDIYLMGVDALPECCEMLLNGTMTGTVLNDHIGQSHTAVDCAIKYLNGETVDQYYWVNYTKVTPANAQDIIDAYYPEA